MNLLDNHLEKAESKEEEHYFQSKIVLTEFVRQCVQCDAYFVQPVDVILMCLCWNCRREREAPELEPIQVNRRLIVLPTLPSVSEVIDNIRKS